MPHQSVLDFRRPDAGANPQLIDADLESIPAFEPAGYRTTSSGRIELSQPNAAMRTVHKRFLEVIGSARGSGHERMARTAAAGNYHYLYILDLQDAFGSIPTDWLVNYLMGWPQLNRNYTYGTTELEVRSFVERYLVHPHGGLIQGAPASPILFARYAWYELDRPLYEWLRTNHSPNGGRICDYDRFVDDMVFMSRQPLSQWQRRIIKDIIYRAGLRINEKKARGVVLRRNTVVLTGVAIRRTRSGIRMFMPRSKLSRLEGLLHYAHQGRLVNIHQIDGLMGAFLLVTDPAHLNATELRVVRAYEQFTGKTIVSRGQWRGVCF
jgi:hypothetical protein